MCMDVCVLFPRSALSCMEMTNDRHPVSLLKNVFPLCSRGSVSRGLHSFPNSSQTSCLSLEPNMHTCFGGAIGRWVTIPHHKYSSLKRVCVSVRVISVHFASQYYLIISERLICCLIPDMNLWNCFFFPLDLSVVIFNCQCACTHGERGGGREMELSFINTWAGKVIVVNLNTFSHRNTEACECQSKQRTAILWETLLHLFLVSLGPRNPWGDPPSPSLQRQVEIHGLSASFCHAD